MAAKANDYEVLDIDGMEDRSEESVPLFKLGGVVYGVHKTIPVGVMLDYMQNSADEEYDGNPMVELMTAVIGEEAYEAIRTNPKVDVAKFKAIWDRVQDVVFKDFTGK
jgi:hypothetical protein